MLARLWPSLAAFSIALALLWQTLNSGLAERVLDNPNHRSLHTRSVPRTGGLAIMAGVLVAGAATHAPWPLLGALAVLAAVSFRDDVCGVPAGLRLAVHALAACAAAAIVLPAGAMGWWCLVVPATVWMINLFNFMDGADGLAGGMALFGFACYGLAGAGEPWAPWSFAVAAAAAAFLGFNFSPARIFMGDSGSIPLGFLAAALGWMGWQRQVWPLWFPLLVFSPFVADASVTLVRRTLRGERIWQAHREHYYQRLVLMGWSHRKLALAGYLLMAAAGASALWSLAQGRAGQWALIAAWTGIYALLMRAVDRNWALFAAGEGRR